MREDMDVDGDIDQNLLQQFSCMGTTDRDVLISQLQKLVGNQLNPAACAFFLDMNNWNLDAAVGSFYDCESTCIKVPSMAFVADITIGEGESICPNTKFIKTWRLKNSGEDSWPPNCKLKFLQGHRFGHMDDVPVKHELLCGQSTDISVEMVSPNDPGIYQGQWRMCTPDGCLFGEVIWVILTVSEAGVLSLTQQMSSFHDLGSPPRNAAASIQNPFGPTCNSICHQQSNSLNDSALVYNSPNHLHTSSANTLCKDLFPQSDTDNQEMSCYNVNQSAMAQVNNTGSILGGYSSSNSQNQPQLDLMSNDTAPISKIIRQENPSDDMMS